MGLDYFYSGNTVINQGDVIDGDVYITGDTILENYGQITGNIYIDDPYNLSIINHNIIDSNFSTVSGATVTQLVSSADDLNIINNLSNHVIKVTNADMLSMADLIAISGEEGNIQISNSSFIIEPGINNESISIWLNGSVSFYVTGVTPQDSGILLTNINGIAYPYPINIDSMYIVTTSIDASGNLVVSVEREMNYGIVLDGKLGDYIDSLRLKNPNDRLVERLDSASTRAELNRVLKKSAKTNPILLSKPIRIVNSLNDMRVFNDTGARISGHPFYVKSDEFNMLGGEISLSGKIYDNIFAKVGGFGGTLTYDGNFDEYNSVLYGGKFEIEYIDADFYVGAMGTVAYSTIKGMDVFNDDKIVRNPHGLAGKFVIDYGRIFSAFDDIKIALFAGGTMDYAKVLNNTETNFNLRAGLESMFNTVYDGNSYGFGLRAFVQTDGDINTSVYSKMLSVADGIGGEINAGLVYGDSLLSYKLGLNINFVF